eukprot:scaffold88207_cov17-Prasinocladus_malaysianus.AAC.1
MFVLLCSSNDKNSVFVAWRSVMSRVAKGVADKDSHFAFRVMFVMLAAVTVGGQPEAFTLINMIFKRGLLCRSLLLIRRGHVRQLNSLRQ